LLVTISKKTRISEEEADVEAGAAIAGGHGGGIEDEGDDAHFDTAEQPADW
jgi:hypothetical protein